MAILTLYPTSPEKAKTQKAFREYATGKPIDSCLYSESPYVGENPTAGTHVVVGPGPYQRKWYGNVVLENGIVTRIK